MISLILIIVAFIGGLSAGYCIGWEKATESNNDDNQ